MAIGGRDLSLELMDDETPRSLGAWAKEIFADLAKVALLLDHAYEGENFQAAAECQHQKLVKPELTPSARMLKDMEEEGLGGPDEEGKPDVLGVHLDTPILGVEGTRMRDMPCTK